jgi:N6-adenosine-specific RNA methylase IME4
VKNEDRRFGVILADPAWAYNQYRDSANGAAKSAYQCMSLDELAEIPVGKWSADDCVLAMWCTNPKLDVGIDLMRYWGFQYKTKVPWIKNIPSTQDMATNVGIWFQGNSEDLLFGVRGNIGGFFPKDSTVPNRKGKLGLLVGDRHNPEFWKRLSERALLAPKVKKHSKKPETMQDYLETFEGPRLELFATRERPGWECWGYDTGCELGPFGVRAKDTTVVEGHKVEWLYDFPMYLNASDIVSLNHAYGTAGKHRYLLPRAKEYKQRWKYLFGLTENFQALDRFIPGAENPWLVFRFTLVYAEQDFAYKTGRLRGVDLTNLFKLIEDAYCEYVGYSDRRTLRVQGDKRASKKYETQIILSVGVLKTSILIEDDLEMEGRFGHLLQQPGEFYDMDVKPPKQLKEYKTLPEDVKASVDTLITSYAVTDDAADALKLSLQEFGRDGIMVFTAVGSLTKRGLLKSGLFTTLMKYLGMDESAVKKAKAVAKKAKTKLDMRGKLPFVNLPQPKKTPKQFLDEWEEKNLKRRQYSSDMLDWETGEINWDAKKVYGHPKGKPVWYVYQALILSRPNYERLLTLTDDDDKVLSKRAVNTALKGFMVEASFLPPGAGVFREDTETGEMWVERDDAKALEMSLPYTSKSVKIKK